TPPRRLRTSDMADRSAAGSRRSRTRPLALRFGRRVSFRPRRVPGPQRAPTRSGHTRDRTVGPGSAGGSHLHGGTAPREPGGRPPLFSRFRSVNVAVRRAFGHVASISHRYMPTHATMGQPFPHLHDVPAMRPGSAHMVGSLPELWSVGCCV